MTKPSPDYYTIRTARVGGGGASEVWDWLEDAFELGNPKEVKWMALEDPILEKFGEM